MRSEDLGHLTRHCDGSNAPFSSDRIRRLSTSGAMGDNYPIGRFSLKLPVPREKLWAWCLLALVFALIYTQAPLYSGNQTTKFLFGMAAAGEGLLSEDWFANTTDPLPVFSFLVRIVHQFLHPVVFYLLYAALGGLYLYGLLGIAAVVYPGFNRSRWWALIALVLFVHAGLLTGYWVEAIGENPRQILTEGVAFQYILGPYFQPSAFGALFPLSILLFLRNRLYSAVLVAAGIAVVHPAYMSSAAVLVVIFASMTLVERRNLRRSIVAGLMALVVVAPVVIDTAVRFAPTSPETWRQAMDIVVNIRIPHHAQPGVWMNAAVAVKALLLVAAIVLVRGRRIFWILLGGVTFVTATTVLQMISGSDTLAFSAPWRLSVILVPVATTLLLARGVALTPDLPVLRRAMEVGAVALIVGLFVYGTWSQVRLFQRSARRPSNAVTQEVRDTMQSGDVYLVPPKDARFRSFRLDSGAPIVVNWRSHPQNMDLEVIDWYERFQLASAAYPDDGPPPCAAIDSLVSRYRVTHMVVPTGRGAPECPGWSEQYRDDFATLYRLDGGAASRLER